MFVDIYMLGEGGRLYSGEGGFRGDMIRFVFGEGRVCTLLGMAVVWCWGWVTWGLGRRRRGKGEVVYAVMREHGTGGFVVEV